MILQRIQLSLTMKVNYASFQQIAAATSFMVSVRPHGARSFVENGCTEDLRPLAESEHRGGGIQRPRSTSRWAMPVRSSAPIALRYSASILAWAHTKLIRQIVLTVTGTELNCSSAASFVMPAAANQCQAPSSQSFGAVHDGHERSEFGRRQASRRPNQR